MFRWIATDTARKLGRLTGLLIESGRPTEAVPLLRRALAAAEEEEQVHVEHAFCASLTAQLDARPLAVPD